MKKVIIIICLICFLLVIILSVCTSSPVMLHNALNDYIKIAGGDMPSDLRLTIYYITPNILTRMPLSVDDLISFSETKKITIEADELAPFWPSFKKLDPADLQIATENIGINARLYYTLETNGSEKLLEVIISQYNSNVFVNGLEIKWHAFFYELIIPFLPEEVRNEG